MSPDSTSPLPPHADLEQQKKLAKELLAAWKSGDASARQRVRRHLPDKPRITLADTQLVLAREHGFASWAKLKAHIEGRPAPTPVERFKHAVERRDAVALREVLERYPEARAAIDAPLFAFGSRALGHSADGEDTAVVETLLDFGADPNARSDWWAGGWHPLHSARGAMADLLLARGAVADACAAAHLDRVDLLRRLLDEDPERVHERGGDGQTPLHFARSVAAADLLLERGADPNARDLDHRGIPAQWMLDGRRGLAAYLVGRGATADVFLAAALGLTDRLRELLAADASVLDLRTSQGEYGEQPPSSYHIYTWTLGANLSPLQVAARLGQEQALEVMRRAATPRQRLLAACARGDAAGAREALRDHPGLVAELTPEEQRALPDAAWADEPLAVELMLELGFDPFTPGQAGGTALHCAAWEGSVPSVRALLRHPAASELIGLRDPSFGGTPLSWCWHGAENCGNPRADHPAVARLLLDAGAELPDDPENMPEALRKVALEWRAGR